MDAHPGTSAAIVEELLELAPYLERVARSLSRDPDAAADLVQDTWLAALSSPPRHRENLPGWLRTVAVNLARKRARQHVLQRLESAPPELWTEDEDDTGERRRALVAAVLELKSPYADVLTLRFLQGLKPAEIAARRETTVNTVNSQLQRGLALLKERLERRRGAWSLLPWRRGARPATVAARLAVAALLAAAVPLALWALWRPKLGPEPVRAARLTSPPALPDEPAGPTPAPEPPASQEPASEADDPPAEEPVAPDDDVVAVVHTLVVDALGVPVRDATVWVVSVGRQTGFGIPRREAGRTDADGRLRVEVRDGEPGPLIVRGERAPRIGLLVSKGERLGPWTYLPMPTVAETEVTLLLSDSAERVEGLVVDLDGRPIEGATVRVRVETVEHEPNVADGRIVMEHARFARSGPDGSFVVTGLPAGRSMVTVSGEQAGYALTTTWVTAGEEPRTFVLGRGGALLGIARDADGTPLPGAMVSVTVRDLVVQLRTGPDGGYAVANVPVGRWLVRARAPGSTGLLSTVTRIEFVEGEETERDLVLVPWPALAIRIVDEAGAPLVDWDVSLSDEQESPWQARQPTDASGWARFVGRPPCELGVTVRPWRTRTSHTVPMAYARVGATQDEVTITVIAAHRPAGLSGFVVDAEGASLGSLRIRIAQEESSILGRCYADPLLGSFRTGPLPPGPTTLTAFAPAHGHAALGEVELSPGQEHDLGTVRLPPMGTLELECAWSVPHEVSVACLAQDEEFLVDSRTATTSSRFTLLPGRYVVEVRHGFEVVARHEVDVESHGTTRLSIGPGR